MSKKISSIKCHYKIYDKKLLAIIYAFEKWYSELTKSLIKELIYIITDYKNLKYFIISKNLNKKTSLISRIFS